MIFKKSFIIYLISLNILIISLYCKSGNLNAHPIHLSVSQLTYSKENASLQISIKLFTNDIESTLKSRGHKNLFRNKKENYPDLNKPLKKYIQDKVVIFVNGEKRKTDFVGKEVNMDVLWCYFEIKKIYKINSIKVKNTILFELFGDQSNLIHVEVNDKNKSMMLEHGDEEDAVEF